MENNYLKIKISKNELLTAIRSCMNVIEGNSYSTSPINHCIRMIVSKNKIEFFSFSHLFSANYEITNDFECFNEGELVIKAKIFFNIVSKLDDEIILEKVDKNSLYIKSNNFESNINLIDETLFPEITFDVEGNYKEINIKSNILYEVEKKLINFVSKQDNVMSYINFSVTNKVLQIAATDSAKLGVLKYDVDLDDLNIKIHPLLLKWLSSFYKNDEEITFKIFDDILIIKYRNLTIKNNTWNDVYPDISPLINITPSLMFNVEKNKILKALERGISLYDGDSAKIRTKLEGTQNEIIIKFWNELNASSVETIEINRISEGKIDVTLSAQYLIQIIKNFEGDIITFKFSSETFNILFNDNYQDNFIQLLAPIITS